MTPRSASPRTRRQISDVGRRRRLILGVPTELFSGRPARRSRGRVLSCVALRRRVFAPGTRTGTEPGGDPLTAAAIHHALSRDTRSNNSDLQQLTRLLCLSVEQFRVRRATTQDYKSSADANVGDRLATIYTGRKVGAAVPLSVGELGSHLTQCGIGMRPTSVPSGILIHPTVWPHYTNVSDRQTDRQDSIA